jgi:glycosyltransferase involved in cell wall biosynthesis
VRIGHYGIRIWDPGGVASYIRRVASEQRAQGHEVLLFDNRPAAPDCAPEWRPSVAARDSDLFAQARHAKLDVLHLHSSVSCPPPAGLCVVRTIHTNEPYCPSGMQYRLRRERPCEQVFGIGTCVKGHLIDHCGSLRPQMLRLAVARIQHERRVLPHLRLLAVSEFVRQRLLASGYPGERIHVLPLTAPHYPDAVPPPPGLPHFVSMGRLVPEKGLTWLLRAWAQVDVPCQLDIAGSGHYRPRLEALVRALNLGGRVRFHGWLEPSRLAALVAQARAVVVPSLWQEPGGTVTFEAMAQGRAVIVSRVGGAAEPVGHGVEGLVITPGDETQLAAAIRQLASDRQLAAAMGVCGQHTARERYGITPHVCHLHEHYAEAGRPGEPTPPHDAARAHGALLSVQS